MPYHAFAFTTRYGSNSEQIFRIDRTKRRGKRTNVLDRAAFLMNDKGRALPDFVQSDEKEARSAVYNFICPNRFNYLIKKAHTEICAFNMLI